MQLNQWSWLKGIKIELALTPTEKQKGGGGSVDPLPTFTINLISESGRMKEAEMDKLGDRSTDQEIYSDFNKLVWWGVCVCRVGG